MDPYENNNTCAQYMHCAHVLLFSIKKETLKTLAYLSLVSLSSSMDLTSAVKMKKINEIYQLGCIIGDILLGVDMLMLLAENL